MPVDMLQPGLKDLFSDENMDQTPDGTMDPYLDELHSEIHLIQ